MPRLFFYVTLPFDTIFVVACMFLFLIFSLLAVWFLRLFNKR